MASHTSLTTRPLKRLYSLPEAGDYLGRSTSAMRAMINAGKIRPVQIDRKIQFDVFDLDLLIEQNKRSPLE